MTYLKRWCHLQTFNLTKDNIYYVLNQKVSSIPFILIGLPLLVIYIICFFYVSVPSSKTYYGTYTCDESCYLTTYLLPEEITKITTSTKIMINHEEYIANQMTFLDVITSNNQTYQGVKVELPKLNYYENQTISYTFSESKETLMAQLIT